MSKYNAKKITNEQGTFDSRREYRRYTALRALEEQGVIENLERQKKYVLIPAQREPDGVGKRGGIIRGKLIERECSYYADFTYYDTRTKSYVVEDSKGYRTPDYKIKKKLMLWVYKIRVIET